jgi:hypothetical protein
LTKQQLSGVYDILDSDVPIGEQLIALLPYTQSESIPTGKLLWLTGWESEILMEEVMSNPQMGVAGDSTSVFSRFFQNRGVFSGIIGVRRS